MTDVMERADSDAADSTESGSTDRRGGWARPVALLAGLLAVLSAVAVPLLPVTVDAATLSWPQGNSTRGVEAPLVSYAPVSFDAEIPCAAVTQLVPDGGTLVATTPNGAPDRWRYGFLAWVSAASTAEDGTTTPARLEAVLRDQRLVSVPVDELGADCALVVHAGMDRTTATLTGAAVAPVTLDGDYRPQLVGIYSDLATAAGTSVTAQIDSRFSSTPTVLKRVAIWTALLGTVVALFALYRLDRRDGRSRRRFLPRRWWTFSLVDGVVLGTLVLWHFIGATTADDGYLFGMGRAAIPSGYMANYFAYFGVPENPVGLYHSLFGYLALISPASPWVRLPALLAGIISWLVISREVIPRLGVRISRNRVAVWTGGLGFLAVWLPYNNGLRPEAAVAVSLLLTWVSVERAVATRRLLPYAVAALIGAFACTAGPSGVICVAPLLAGIRPMWRALDARARELSEPVAPGAGFATTLRTRFGSYLSLIAPVAAAGTVVLAAAFADQTAAAMLEMRHVHELVGPNVQWYDEYLRYQYLFMPTIDGSVARRFGMFMFWAGLLVCAFVLLRRGGGGGGRGGGRGGGGGGGWGGVWGGGGGEKRGWWWWMWGGW
ncbi:arabinosyltransferase domain-containing protein, partial [Nocardia otitidiscaviarum]|uniref:arabinosyltransferase domain-containing protein n=1 Tax=Nocardia otitidiscaviarum TaxID=1823 RepID=UPI002457BA0B